MIRYTIDNVKSSLRSRYFLLGVLILVGVFFCSKGIGELCVQVQETPLIIQELFKYTRQDFNRAIDTYNVAYMFMHGMGGFMYLALPLAGLGFLLLFCDERYGGYDRMILARIGKRNYFGGTLLTAAILGILTVVVSSAMILAVLYLRLPSGAGVEGIPGISECLRYIAFACVLVVIGNWLGFLTAVLTDSRFMAMVLPVLVSELWTELCNGAPFDSKMVFLSMSRLFDPIRNNTPIGMYLIFVAVGLIAFGGGFYVIAVRKLERGR